MTDEPHQPSPLDQSPRPTAIVHEGFFVYANQAFLDRLGYRQLEDLEAVPLLDMVEEDDHDRLREHLESAKRTPGTDKHPPEARLSLRRADNLPCLTKCVAFRTRYEGEDCVQLNLQAREDDSFSGRVKRLPWRHYLSLVFLLLFTVLPSSLLLKLNIDNAPEVYFPTDEPAVVLDRELRTRFPNDQVFVLLFEGVALYSDGFLKAYDELGKSLRKHEAINDLVSLTVQDHIAGTQDEFIVERLIDVRKLDQSRPEEREHRAVTDRFSKGALTSLDGSALAMVIIPAQTADSIKQLALEEDILHAVDRHKLGGYLRAVAGQIPVNVAQLRSMLRDNMIFIPATVTIGLTLIWWLFRRWLAVMLAGVAIGVVVNSTVAIYVLLDQPFTLISSIIPPLLSALTIAALVHLFNALMLASKLGLHGAERVARAVKSIDRPAFFAALTTAGGLASLASSPIVPITVFGLIAAAGTLMIYVVVFRVLPNVIVRWDKSDWRHVGGSAQLVDRVVSVFYRTGLRHPLAVIALTCAAMLAGFPQISKVVVETNLQEFFSYEHKVRQDTRYIDDKLVGTTTVSVIFDGLRRGDLQNPKNLALIADFQAWVNTQPEVDRSMSLVDFIEEMHWGFNAEKPEFRKLPENGQLISQYLLIYDGEDLYDFVDRDFQHSQTILNLNVHSANKIASVLQRIRTYLDEHVGEQLSWEIAGHGRLFADMEDLLVSGQIYSLWGALALVFVFMLLLLRSVGAAILCMIPNLSPIYLIFVIMGISGIWLDMGTAMIASVAIGIAVDDTIHIYHGFHRRVKAGVSPVIALARTYRSAGRAVVTTTLILAAQFLVLVLSDFVPTRNFGVLTAVGLIAALVFDLLFLPALLIVIHGANSPVAAFFARLGGKKAAGEDGMGEADPGVNESFWTTERKTLLIREILSGKMDTAAAANDYALPENEVERWLAMAERGMHDALDGKTAHASSDPDKLRALAKAYKKLKAENKELREFHHIRNI